MSAADTSALAASGGTKSFRFSSDVSGVLERDWLLTEPARAYVDALFHEGRRIRFGLLEQPTIKVGSVPRVGVL